MRSRGSVPIAENMSAYLMTWSELVAARIFLYLQNYEYMSSCVAMDSREHNAVLRVHCPCWFGADGISHFTRQCSCFARRIDSVCGYGWLFTRSEEHTSELQSH